MIDPWAKTLSREVAEMRDMIAADFAGKSVHGTVTCIVCGRRLEFSHSAENGHVWGKCSTEYCLAWME